jgi:hypothetical protein
MEKPMIPKSTTSMTAKRLPPYIERGGEQSLVPPGHLQRTQFYIFILKGAKTKLQSLADRLFNEPSGRAVDYRAVSDYVVLMFTQVGELTSAQADQGRIAYDDIALWVPFIAVKKRLGIEMADRVVMYPPYIFVDNAATMVTGREVFGLPKQMGWFSLPATPTEPTTFTTDVVGYAADSRTRQNVPTRLWSVERRSIAPAGPQRLHNIRQLLPIMENFWRSILLENWLLPNLPNMLAELILGVPALGLKQFRDAAQVNQACYQAIIEAPLQLKAFHEGWFYADSFDFVLHDLGSHPVAHEIGLQIGAQPIALSLYLHLDMHMAAGNIQWDNWTGLRS